MDDPHLVTMENSLQDLLDAVTIANSRQVSRVALGWPGRGVATGGMGKAGVRWSTGVQSPALGEARKMRGFMAEGDAGHKGVLLSPKVSCSSPCSASPAGPKTGKGGAGRSMGVR